MINLMDKLDIKEWLKLNAQLQLKKSKLRTDLKEKGILKREGNNTYDNYSYFTEAQYKKLFTELFAKNQLELTSNELSYEEIESNSEKQPNGRKVTFEFILTDCETGFYEAVVITGEGLDKGDKAGYKADTGALKYYLANNFMVATGDDAEKDSPASETSISQKATLKQIQLISKNYKGENLAKLLQANNIEKLEDLSKSKASEICDYIFKKIEEKKQQIDINSNEETF